MATTKRPVVHDDTNNVLAPIADGQVLEPSVLPVSTVDGNVLAVEEDGLAVTAESLVSDDASNRLVVQDGKLMVEPETVNITVVSDDEGNLITAGTDHGAFLARERMQNFVNNLIDDALDDVTIVSRDTGNYLTRGSDDGAYLSEETFTSDVNELIEDAIDNVVIVSKDDGNALDTGSDGGAFLNETALDSLVDSAIDEKLVDFSTVSKDEGNLIRTGSDGGVFADGNDLLSNGDVNLLTINEVDKKIILTRDAVLTVTAGELVKDDDLILKDEDGKIVSEICLSYDQLTGVLTLTGVDGQTVCEATVPSQTASLKSVEFVTTKADESGEAIEGEYTTTIQFKDALLGWLDPVEVKVTTTKDTAGSFAFEMDTDEDCGGLPTGVMNARGWFNGQSAQAYGSTGTIPFVFTDGSTLNISSYRLKEDNKGYTGSGTFTPAVGLSTGAWLRFVFRLHDGGICEMYVDVAYLIDIYTAGNGIDITSNVVSAKAGTGITVDENGVQIDQDWFDQNVGDIIGETVDGGNLIKAGDGITVATSDGSATVSAKAGTGVTVDSNGINVDTTWFDNRVETVVDSLVNDGELIAAGDGIGVSTSGTTATVSAKAGTGITVDSNGINVDIDPDGGLVVEEGGLSVDFDSMPTDRFEALLKSIKVPIWLTANKSFYVNGTTGSDDTNIEGIGESEDKPFKTIQACVTYVTDNYNISSYTCTIYIAPGTYEESVTLPDYNRTTGSIVICGQTATAPVITTTNRNTIQASTGGLWYLRNIDIVCNTSFQSGVLQNINCACVYVSSYSVIYIQRCRMTVNCADAEEKNYNITVAVVWVTNNATVYFSQYNNPDWDPTRMSINNAATSNVATRFILERVSGNCIASTGTSGERNAYTCFCSGMCDIFIYLQNSSVFFAESTTTEDAYIFSGEAVTGQRYRIITGAICNVNGQGAEYFPGDTVGSVDESTYCWYN